MTNDAADGQVRPETADSLHRLLVEQLGPAVVQRLAPLGDRTTYRVGGAAAVLVEPESVDHLVVLSSTIRGAVEQGADDVEILVVGRGSNMLVADAGFHGVAVALGEGFSNVEIDDTVVHVGAAAKLPVVARQTASAGLTGFEWAVGVPGSIGGAVRMNAGGHGADMAASLAAVEVFDVAAGDKRVLRPELLELGYRTSAIVSTQVVTGATLQLARGDAQTSKDEISQIVRWRLDHQPGGQNAGSVFTNPPDDSAGRLIDVAGLKGQRVGSAEVSVKHANFIQVDPGGRADDVFALMQRIIAEVRAHSGVTLHPETRLVGFDGLAEGASAPA